MKIINNRYKIDKCVDETPTCIVYMVTDLWNKDKKLFLNVFNYNKHIPQIDYFISEFITIANIKHKYLLACEEFNIIKSIDRESININQYYYVSDYVDKPTLEDVREDLDLKDRLTIIQQLCTVIDFLHFRGFTYKHLTPKDIYIFEDGSIKITDLATIEDAFMSNDYDVLGRYFISPEVFLNEGNIDYRADYYSIGMIIKYLFPNEFLHDENTANKRLKLSNKQIEFLMDVIQNLTGNNVSNRNGDLKDVILSVNEYFGLDYIVDYKKEREQLNFNTKIVGRDKEIKRLKDIDNNINKKGKTTKLVLLDGESGVGKTRLLNEIAQTMELRGRVVYKLELNSKENISFKSITDLLKQMIKTAPKILVQKYGSELVKVIPKLANAEGIKPSTNLVKEKEILRMYDRISNFIIELSKLKPMYIIIDNFYYADDDTLKLINYILHYNKDAYLLLILSYNNDLLEREELGKLLIKYWLTKDYIEEIKLSKLSLQEIGDMVKNILGMSFKPLNFSTALLKEALGNPRYIELILQDLFAIGELRIVNSIWHLMTFNYSDIFLPSNIDDTLRKQLMLFEDKIIQLLKIISVFNGPVSKSILLNMLEIDIDGLNEMIEKLISMRLLDERVGDWGYSYTIYNIQLKKLLYHDLLEGEKEKLHRKAAKILEKSFNLENIDNVDELIYHLTHSNQRDKAVEYLICQAKKMGPELSNQSISTWERAYELMDDMDSELKLEVLLNIGKLNQATGNNDGALKIYDEVLKESKKLDAIKYNIQAKIYIGEIYLRRNEVDKAESAFLESIELSENIDYIEGLLKAKILLTKVLSTKDEMVRALNESNQLLNIVNKYGMVEFLGTIYNQMGIIFFLKGDMESAKDFYEKSIESYQKAGITKESAKPLNNLGNIYNDYYGDKVKSMECYNRGLEICSKNNYLDVELVFLNNIGETYIESYNYEKAKKYIEKARNIALEIEDKSIILLTNINLGQIYLILGEFNNAFNCYNLTKNQFERSSSLSKELTCQYYDFMGNFYFKFGKWKEASKYYVLERNTAKNFHANYYLISNSRIVVCNYFKNNFLDKSSMEVIRKNYRESKLNFDMEKVLTEFAFISFLNGDYSYALELLEDIRGLSVPSYSKLLDFMQNLIFFSIKEDKSSLEYLLDMEDKVKGSELYEIDFYYNLIIGEKFYSIKDYYKAINYYLESLDIMYRLIKKIPSKELQLSYIKSRRGDEIKIQINSLLKKTFNIDVISVLTEDVKNGKSDLGNYFDFKNLLDLIGNENFKKIISTSTVNSHIKDINSITDLISSFSYDYNFNLDLILKYIAKETIAQKGIICYYDDDDEIKTIASLNDENYSIISESIISMVNKTGDGIIIKNSFSNTKASIYEELLPIDTKALVCMPIVRPESTAELDYEDRRKETYIKGHPIIGYIYIETDRIFNRIDYERYMMIKTLSYLTFLNIDNYKLKSLCTIDKMTGIYSRKYFDLIFKNLLDGSIKHNETFSLLMIDIDKFKDVNDTYGHRKGDEVLSIIGQILINNTRATDIVARYGGEEFIIVLFNTKEKDAIKVAEKIRRHIEDFKFPNIDYPLTISIGVSLYPKHSQFSSELIEKADQALYYAKERGRNKVVLWESNIANNIKRSDRLAGIISGNTVHDQRNVLAIMDVIDLNNMDLPREDKIYEFLGRLIESVDAEYGMFILLDEKDKLYSRQRFEPNWIKNIKYNKKIIDRVIKNKKGEFLIDWENIKDIDILSGTPNWQSLIAIPLVISDIVKGVVYLTVPIKEKEFDYNNYNLVNTICEVFLSII